MKQLKIVCKNCGSNLITNGKRTSYGIKCKECGTYNEVTKENKKDFETFNIKRTRMHFNEE